MNYRLLFGKFTININLQLITIQIAVIIPFRKREQHLRSFLHFMLPVFQRQQINFRIYVIQQVRKYKKQFRVDNLALTIWRMYTYAEMNFEISKIVCCIFYLGSNNIVVLLRRFLFRANIFLQLSLVGRIQAFPSTDKKKFIYIYNKHWRVWGEAVWAIPPPNGCGDPFMQMRPFLMTNEVETWQKILETKLCFTLR